MLFLGHSVHHFKINILLHYTLALVLGIGIIRGLDTGYWEDCLVSFLPY